MANTRTGSPSKSSTRSTSNSKSGGKGGSDSSTVATSTTSKSNENTKSNHKSKSLRPLSTVLGFGGSSSASASPAKPFSSSSSASLHPPRKKKRKTGSFSDPADPIELSSDTDDNDDVLQSDDDFLEVSKANAADSNEDIDLEFTGHAAASSSGSRATSSAKMESSSRQKAPSKSSGIIDNNARNTVSKNDVTKPILSDKAKGKRKAEESTLIELHVTDNREGALWSQKYEPVDFDSLCVHKKKVQDVQRWLEEAYAGGVTSKYRRILVLTGPAGSAKTATLRVLSREMDFDVVEYKTSEGDSETFANQFPAFLAKATLASSLRFGVLTSDDRIAVAKDPTITTKESFTKAKAKPSTLNDFTIPKTASTHSAADGPKRRKLILIEDLPNIFTSQNTKNAFRDALGALATSKRYNNAAPNANVPVVVIVSESLTRPGQNEGELAANRYQGSGEQSVSVRSVLPPDVLRSPVTAEFKFNPVAPTLMKKALNAILDREYEARPDKRPSQRAVQLVIEAADGDIRSALNTLQFVVGGAAPTSEEALRLAKKKGKKRKSGGKVNDDEADETANKALLHLVAAKESSLFLFHALGKVLFNKRWGENPEEDAKSSKPLPPKPQKLPPHLKVWERRISKVDTNALFSDAPVDSDMFMAYLHQNFPPFCDDIGQCSSLMDYTSAADAIMRMEGDNFSRHALTSHYSFQTAVRGALLALPSPVQRRGQKMYKSEIWEVQRKARDNADRVGDWIMLSMKCHGSTEEGEELLPKRVLLQLELLPFMGLIQAPHKSFLAAANNVRPTGAEGSLFKRPQVPNSVAGVKAAMTPPWKLSSNLLELAMFPPPTFMAPPSQDFRSERGREALNEKDIPDDAEAEEDDMKLKPSAPAIKVDTSRDTNEDNQDETAEAALNSLYISDDDIGDF